MLMLGISYFVDMYGNIINNPLRLNYVYDITNEVTNITQSDWDHVSQWGQVVLHAPYSPRTPWSPT